MIEVKATRKEYENLIAVLLGNDTLLCRNILCKHECCSDCLKERIIILKEEVEDAE
jgi:hypothetical protein